ncbi:AraC-like ligand-binding domain-containing protein [Glutamicibacter protophormiae]|uniref:AraC-like DNA-binding protein n=1 Tax=Glutamicibacter protophormiae TaxID=37930 RepID=A0ABS4XKR2_GLUPR|nr:helix-turn-helix domain-containing protein [Glutamicibacter protophormiae]MBP2397079.1 AraC-like DNA-binding protein [Glutamicibacter protophormiae]GGL98121.1 AraC family transcriptional regulator [Glutamicibacter protophormiae]
MYQVQHVDSFSAWSALISDAFVQLRSEQVSRGHFAATLGANMLGDIGLMRITAKPHAVLRTEDLSTSGDGDYYKVSYQLDGHGLLVQDGRETVLSPGDLAIYDTQRPYALAFEKPASVVVALVPHDQFRLSPQQVAQITAVALKDEHPLAGTVTPLLRHLGNNLSTWDQFGGYSLARNTVDLIATALAGALGGENQADSKSAQRQRITAYIDAHLDEPELDPARIAAAHFISVRSLHALFEHEPRTVAALIRHRRMQQASALLRDPLLGDVSVQRIGARVGIPDAAGFSRMFSREFALTPGRYRQQQAAA